MLSSKSFTTGMAVLMDRFGRPLQPPTLKLYYKILSPLTDAEFSRAVERIIGSESFFPAANMIVDAARPPRDLSIDAEDAWGKVLTTIRAIPWRMIPRGVFNTDEWKVIASVGGLDAIANMTHDAEPHVHRRFLEAFAERASVPSARALTDGEIDPRAAMLVTNVAKKLAGGDQ